MIDFIQIILILAILILIYTIYLYYIAKIATTSKASNGGASDVLAPVVSTTNSTSIQNLSIVPGTDLTGTVIYTGPDAPPVVVSQTNKDLLNNPALVGQPGMDQVYAALGLPNPATNQSAYQSTYQGYMAP